MTQTWTGYTTDARRYTLALRHDGELYSGGRNTPYSKCSKSFADKRRACPDLNDYERPAAERLSAEDRGRLAHLVEKAHNNRRRNRG